MHMQPLHSGCGPVAAGSSAALSLLIAMLVVLRDFAYDIAQSALP